MQKKNIKAVVFERLGRTFEWNDIVWCGLSGTGIRFTTNAEKIIIHLIGDSSANGQITEGPAKGAILIDNVKMTEFIMEKPEVDLLVENVNMRGTAHEVKIIKLSECAMSTFGIGKITLEGEKVPEIFEGIKKNMKIEFIGDSITCGYGVNLEDPEAIFSTYTEDCTKAYAYRTAEKLDADYSLVSFSGYGIISGYTVNDEIHRDQLVPTYYDKCGFSYAHPMYKGESGPDFSAVEWDFEKFIPDIIVINLGTNDSSYCGTNKERLDWYKKDYKKFIKHVRSKNSNAKILCCLGLMDAGLNIRALEELVSEYKTETRDENIYFFQIPLQKEENGFVIDYHPTVVSHEQAATLVAEKIREII